MTDAEHTTLVRALRAANLSYYVNPNGVRFDLAVDAMTGCINYRADSAEISVYCTPDWETDLECVCISVSNDDGELLYSDDHEWPAAQRTEQSYFEIVRPHLDRITPKAG